MPNRSDAKAQSVFAGVDWISGSLEREAVDDQQWLYDCMSGLWAIAELGNVYKRRPLLGFDGWEAAGCFVGSNETHHYAQFAGKYAHDAYRMLEHPKVHIARIDVQITVQYDIELPKEGRFQYARAVHHNKGLPAHRQRKINLYAGSDGGDTVYVGSPSSDVRGRLYNKAKQSMDASYERSWRYEVVYRNAYAARMFRQLLNADIAAAAIISTNVVAWYHARGVDVLDLGNRAEHPLAPLGTPKSDVDRKLKWIKQQVVPTIRKLAEMGYAEELMDLIGEAIAAARNEQL